MLRYFLSLIVFCGSFSVVFASDEEESQVECLSANHKLVITHIEDTSNTVGMYRFELNASGQNTESFNASSVDYFSLMDKLWQSGSISFANADNADSDTVFKIDGAPFAKRLGTFNPQSAAPESMRCEVKTGLPLVSCLTQNPEVGATQYAVQFRHATDMGTSTGYYISRIFRIWGDRPAEFETKILGAFSLNRRLLQLAFEVGKETHFQVSSGEKIVLTDWVSTHEFNGHTDLGGGMMPVSCALN